MECVMCTESEFNRVLVDVYEGKEHGGLCTGCEQKAKPVQCLRAGPPSPTKCLRCSRDGHVAIPKLDCYIEHRGRELLEYDIVGKTPRLCYRCLDQLFPEAVGSRIGDVLP